VVNLGGDQRNMKSFLRNCFLFQSTVVLDACIPKVWPDDIAQVLKAMKDAPQAEHRLTRQQKLLMIRKITDRALDNGLSPPQFPWVADYVLQELPALKSSVIAGSVSTSRKSYSLFTHNTPFLLLIFFSFVF